MFVNVKTILISLTNYPLQDTHTICHFPTKGNAPLLVQIYIYTCSTLLVVERTVRTPSLPFASRSFTFGAF